MGYISWELGYNVQEFLQNHYIGVKLLVDRDYKFKFGLARNDEIRTNNE